MSFDAKAFADYLREDPEGINQTHVQEHAEAALLELFLDGMSPTELLPLTRHFQFGNELLAYLVPLFKERDRWKELMEALSKVAEAGIDEGFYSIDAVRELLEDYFTANLQWQITRGDWRRAWATLGEARRGWKSTEVEEGAWSFVTVSDGKLKALGLMLFQAMRGVLPYLEEYEQTVLADNIALLGSTARPPKRYKQDGAVLMTEYFHDRRTRRLRAKTAAKVAQAATSNPKRRKG